MMRHERSMRKREEGLNSEWYSLFPVGVVTIKIIFHQLSNESTKGNCRAKPHPCDKSFLITERFYAL